MSGYCLDLFFIGTTCIVISPDLFSLLNLGIVLRITERGGEKVWSVLDYEISVRIKMEARSSFFYIKACYTELLVLKEQT